MGRTRTTTGRAATARATGLVTALYESDIQANVFELMKTLRLANGRSLHEYAYAVPNGSMLAGTPAQRARYMAALQKQGLKPGVSDIVIALPLGTYHGAYIELKRDKNSKTTQAQKDWRALMHDVGYFSRIAVGQDAAFAAVQEYWRGDLLRVVLP
jgi:hypothetical protein